MKDQHLPVKYLQVQCRIGTEELLLVGVLLVKGLVQNGFYMQDGSMVRLTIARYYTPTGRLIQRPYEDGLEKYINGLLFKIFQW